MSQFQDLRSLPFQGLSPLKTTRSPPSNVWREYSKDIHIQALLILDSHGACQNEMYKTKEVENNWMLFGDDQE